MRQINKKKKVLFICTHNSARSQMAEGLLKHFHGDRYDVYSAGTDPTKVNPYAIKVMEEIGIDISKNYSKNIDKFLNDDFEFIITVCDRANEFCPFFPGGKKRLHKSFEDPSEFEGSNQEKLDVFRQIRDEIKEWINKIFT
ncbi:MAG: arsenate reductase ArsC [Candidatus Helarchaeota archaeon]